MTDERLNEFIEEFKRLMGSYTIETAVAIVLVDLERDMLSKYDDEAWEAEYQKHYNRSRSQDNECL